MHSIFPRIIAAVATFVHHSTPLFITSKSPFPEEKWLCHQLASSPGHGGSQALSSETRNPEAAPSKSTVCCVPQCPPDKRAPSLGVRAKFCSRIVAPRSEKFHEWASFFSHGHSPALLCSVRSEECICSPEPQFPRLPPVCRLQKTTLIFLYMPKVVGFGTFRVSAKSVGI